MFFDGWSGVGRVLIVAIVAYSALIFLLQVFGKRTLATMTAFDFVVTVAIGSILANILLSKDTVFVEGMIAFAVLLGMQYIMSSFSSRSRQFESFIKSGPRLLVYQGQFLTDAMQDERVTEADVLFAIRQRGSASIEDVEAVVLESNGSISVIAKTEGLSGSALENVANYSSKRAQSEQNLPQ
jgi:uncharacterized membrane protein YcaP (DUF421 family)